MELRKGACDYLCEMLQKGTQPEVSEVDALSQLWILVMKELSNGLEGSICIIYVLQGGLICLISCNT